MSGQSQMQEVKLIGLSIVWLLLLGGMSAMMIKHFHQIAISRGPIEEESPMLREITNIIPGGMPVSFATNLSDEESSQGAYYTTQFCLCPRVLSDDTKKSELIIYYRSSAARDSDIVCLRHCDTLLRRPAGAFTLLLLRKTKSN